MSTPIPTWLRFFALSSVIFVLGCYRQDDRLIELEGISSLTVRHTPSTAFSELAWSPDGRFVAARAYAGQNNSTVTVINLQTGETQRLYESGKDSFHGPEWSPDGQSLIFHIPISLVSPLGGGPVEVIPPYNMVVVDADTGQLTHDLGFGSYATWTMESERIIMVGFSSSCEKEVSIDDYDLTTKAIRTIGFTSGCSPEAFDSLDVSIDGKLVVPSTDGTQNQILDIASGTEKGTITPMRGGTVWSPDGTMLAFIAKELDSRVATDGIMLASADGACFSEPLRLDTYLYSLDWSPDGSRLVFSTRDVNRLYFLDLTTGVGKDLMDSFRENCAG